MSPSAKNTFRPPFLTQFSLFLLEFLYFFCLCFSSSFLFLKYSYQKYFQSLPLQYFYLRFCYLCALIYFSFLFLLNKPFTSIPKIHVTVQHGILNQAQDAMNIWIANVSTNHFEVCLQESTTFDGLHDKLSVVC